MTKRLRDLIREMCSEDAWSLGVRMARQGQVLIDRHSEDQIVARVAIPGRVISPRVTLWPREEEWLCDCKGDDDPCGHVAAVAIAMALGAELRPAAASTRSTLGYRFERTAEGLKFFRVLCRDGEEGAFVESITREPRRTDITASQEDVAAEFSLGHRLAGGVLPAEVLVRVLMSLTPSSDVRLDGHPVKVGEARAALLLSLTDEGRGFRLIASPDPALEVSANGALYDPATATLHPIQQPDLPREILQELQRGRSFAAEEVALLVSQVLPRLEQQFALQVHTARLPKGRAEPPRLVVESLREGAVLCLLPILVYGEPEQARVVGDRLVFGRDGSRVPLRDREEEERLAYYLEKQHGMKPGRAVRVEGDEAISRASALGSDPRLRIEGEAARSFQHLRALIPRIQWADQGMAIGFQAGDGSRGPGQETSVRFEALLSLWREGRTLLELPEGEMARLPADWLERYGSVVESLLTFQRENGGRLPRAALPDLAGLMEGTNGRAPEEVARIRESLADFRVLPDAPLPGDLRATLRDYQQKGVNWLSFLESLGIGALLADDMGLGKTLQVLCLFDSAVLVVAPTSVLSNWAKEIERFRPGLTVNVYHGAGRKLDPAAAVTLTTYGILRSDSERLAAVPFRTVVLDEAQVIKNPDSQIAKAAYGLQAGFRVVLTGTPLENRLTDLWSQFHFLHRGLLGSRADFTERYEGPIAAGKQPALDELRRRIRPFLLRRMKSEVARELPPRTDVVLRCELSAREREIYDAVFLATRADVVKRLESGQGVMAALEALLRLRQAACHSALLPGQAASTSAKLELLLETLEEALAEGHKALIFSQWTSLLDLLEPHLHSRGVAFLRLDGSTRDRQQVIESFQDPSGPAVLIISLKAGGVGLNLTAADHVFLLDPWWNPAVEDQAADRAHRIGQMNPVLVHRLVALDTVEEGILRLQEQKRKLAEAALDDGDYALGLTREDLLALFR